MKELTMTQLFLKWADEMNNYSGNTYSQIGQDIFVLSALNKKKNGFFVEFGALDGEYLSNTYLLESEFNWNGILAEPNKKFKEILKNKRSCNIDYRAVADQSGKQLLFKETDIELGMSGLVDYLYDDMHANRRRNSTGDSYSVTTISLNELLVEHNAPCNIDYVSIDTEGSELLILENFDFSKYKISIFTIEHNHTLNREKIQQLMEKNGYMNVLSNRSKHDDWFILKDNFYV
jgi:FkbM family methyltransferase